MPLDGHNYLRNQGWSGKGTGLRHGSISRPLTIPQKRTLAGVGKDRDEAFPFWDHVFAAAATAIQVKLANDDDSSEESTPAPQLNRTSTGILSNRRPLEGTPATSGSSTPTLDPSNSNAPRLSLIATAKKEAAKRGLYSRFFKGPIVGPIDVEVEMIRTEALVSPTKPVEQSPKVLDAPSKERGPGLSGDELKKPDKEKDDKRKKRKRKDADANISAEDIDKKERKRRKREQREAGMASKRRPHENDGAGVSDPQPDGPVSVVEDDLSPQTRDERKKRTKKKDKLADRDGEANERSPEYSKSSSHPSTDTVLTQGDQPNSLSVKKKHRVRADDDSPHADLAFDAQHRKKKRRKKQDTE